MKIYASVEPAEHISYTAHSCHAHSRVLEGHGNILLRLSVIVVPLPALGIPLQRLSVRSLRLGWSAVLLQPLDLRGLRRIGLEEFLDLGLEVCGVVSAAHEIPSVTGREGRFCPLPDSVSHTCKLHFLSRLQRIVLVIALGPLVDNNEVLWKWSAYHSRAY